MTLPSGNGPTTKAKSLSICFATDETAMALATGAATSAKQDTGNTSLATIAANQTNGTQVVKSPQNTTFTPDVIRGTIGGGALSTDSSPSGSGQANSFRMAANRGLLIYGLGSVSVIAYNGTSITFQVWWYDDTNNVWAKIGAATTITVGTNQLGSVTVGAMTGALFYVQITANTGVEKISWFFR